MLTAWFACLALLGAAPATPPLQLTAARSDVGAETSIDWTTGVVRVAGHGLFGEGNSAQTVARRAAMVDGYRNLAEAIKGVTVTAAQSVQALEDENAAVKTRLDAYIQGARVVDEKVSDGPPKEVVLILEAPLHGADGLARAVSDLLADKPEAAPPKGTSEFTGVVLDVRRPPDHQGDWPLLRPALFPRVTDPQGKLLYGPGCLEPQVLATSGAAAYFDVDAPEGRDVDAAQLDLGAAKERVGEHPLYVRGWPVAGQDSTIYLDEAGSAKLRELADTPALKQGHVVFLRRNLPPKGTVTATTEKDTPPPTTEAKEPVTPPPTDKPATDKKDPPPGDKKPLKDTGPFGG